MVEKRNITVAVEPALLEQASAVAARRGRSLSDLLSEKLRDLPAEDHVYETARSSAKTMLKAGLDLCYARMRDRSEAHSAGRRFIRLALPHQRTLLSRLTNRSTP